MYMQRVHRLAGLLAALSLVASVLVTSGFACGIRGGADDMAGMAKADVPNPASPVVSVSLIAADQGGPAPVPCGLPGVPSTCQSMVACCPAAVASESVRIAEQSPVVRRVASAVFLTPRSETIAPELPPPRA